MRREVQWLLLSLGTITVLLGATTRQAGAYEYVHSTDVYESEEATPEDKTSTHWEWATASADTDELYGECTCYTETYDSAEEDSAVSEAYATAAYEEDWVWNGPPGSNPPGGTLDWSLSGSGEATAHGKDFLTDTWSVADGQAVVYGSGPDTAGSTVGEAYGYVIDLGSPESGSGWSLGGLTEPWWTDPDKEEGSGYFQYTIPWKMYDTGYEPIASGTSRVDTGAVADCDSWSATAGADGETWASAFANLTFSADFE